MDVTQTCPLECVHAKHCWCKTPLWAGTLVFQVIPLHGSFEPWWFQSCSWTSKQISIHMRPVGVFFLNSTNCDTSEQGVPRYHLYWWCKVLKLFTVVWICFPSCILSFLDFYLFWVFVNSTSAVEQIPLCWKSETTLKLRSIMIANKVLKCFLKLRSQNIVP